MTSRRTLVVQIEEIAIEDGEIAPPRVGEVMSFPLRFVELPESAGDVVTVRVPLEPSTRPPIRQYTGEDTPRSWEWSGLLRGDGWTASWRGFRPLTGRVELTGRFYGVLGNDDGRVRGRVTRVRIVSARFRRRTPGGWEIVPGHRRLRDVDAAPRFFDRDALFESESDEADGDVGALVDLDLDDVPELPARPSIVPGDVSAAGGVLWAADSSLPLVVSFGADHVVGEHVLPAAIGKSRRIWATLSGCWVTGADGVFRCEQGESPTQVDDTDVQVAAVLGETLLVCRPDGRWVVHEPDRDRIDVAGPEGHVISVVAEDDRFVAAVRVEGSALRLVSISPDGGVTIGSALTVTGRQYRMFLAGAPLRLFGGDRATLVREDLTLGASHTLPKALWGGGRVGPFVWFTDHPPDGTGRSGWWPLAEPATCESTRQFWLFTLLDGRTPVPVSSTPVFTTHPRVTIDDHGTVLLIADGVRVIPGETMRWPEQIDVAALVDEERG
ncbi:hypothetical protein GS505_06800 [Rhodococcus hoagii]|uniref:Uncharacterized protein n=1 Tax=Rhodococcus hoagii TaxID=43767 RepID=A0AAE4ZE92_RHOHA|nr:hypothetical protein [Prescottella equi]